MTNDVNEEAVFWQRRFLEILDTHNRTILMLSQLASQPPPQQQPVSTAQILEVLSQLPPEQTKDLFRQALRANKEAKAQGTTETNGSAAAAEAVINRSKEDRNAHMATNNFAS